MMADRIIVEGDVDLRNEIDGDVDLRSEIDGDGGVVMQYSTTDHNALVNRDLDDQHPINAITRLGGELEVRPSQSLTNMDIQLILNS